MGNFLVHQGLHAAIILRIYTYCMWLYSNGHQLSTNEVPMITVDDCTQPTSNQVSPLATTYCGFLVQTTTERENTTDKETLSDHRTV